MSMRKRKLKWQSFFDFFGENEEEDKRLFPTAADAVVVAFLWSVKNALCRQIYSRMQHTVYYL